MSYKMIGWENKPSTNTPLGAKNLSHMDKGIFDAHEEISRKASAIILNASGEVITVTDSGEEPLKSMKVFGKSWQNTVGGNQLLPIERLIIANSNNYIFTNVKYASEGVIPITGGESYVLSFAKCLADKGLNVFDVSNNKLSCTVTNKTVGEGVTMSFTAPENAVSMSFYAKITTDGTTSISLAQPMLNKGTSALPFEPYVGGIPSPNPNYPQDIHSNGESGSIEYGLYGGNLLDDSTLTCANTETNQYYPVLYTKKWHVEEGKTYTLSFDTENTGVSAYINNTCGFDYKTFTMDGKRHSFTKKMTTTVYRDESVGGNEIIVSIGSATGKAVGNISNVMLTLVEGYDVYEPYKEPQSLTLQTPNGLNGLKVTKQEEANYTDSDGNMYACDYIDFERGKYVQRIAEVVLDGSKVYGFNNSGKWHMSFNDLFGNGDNILQGAVAGGCYAMCDTFLLQSSTYNCNNGYENYMYFSSSSSNKAVAVNINLFETPNESGFKKFFSEHPTIIMAILKTPIETDLTEEEIAQYKALHTNYPNTTIINDANAYTKVEYVADTKLYIDKKFNELASQLL